MKDGVSFILSFLIATVGHLSITMEFIYFSRVLRPLNIKSRTQTRPLSCGLVEHCTGNVKVVGSNPVQSLIFSRSFFPAVLWLHSHLSFLQDYKYRQNSATLLLNPQVTMMIARVFLQNHYQILRLIKLSPFIHTVNKMGKAFSHY